VVRNSKQAWEVGATVKVGFLNLQVVAKVPTPGDWLPDAYDQEQAVLPLRAAQNGLTHCESLAEAMVA
jgi:hypothetical protein